MPANHPFQAEQPIFTQVPGSVRDSYIIPKTVHLGDKLYLSAYFLNQVKVFFYSFFLRWKAFGKRFIQVFWPGWHIDPLITYPAMLIGGGIHSEKNKFLPDTQPFVKIAGRFALIHCPDIVYSRAETMSVNIKAMAPSSWHIMLFNNNHFLSSPGKA